MTDEKPKLSASTSANATIVATIVYCLGLVLLVLSDVSTTKFWQYLVIITLIFVAILYLVIRESVLSQLRLFPNATANALRTLGNRVSLTRQGRILSVVVLLATITNLLVYLYAHDFASQNEYVERWQGRLQDSLVAFVSFLAIMHIPYKTSLWILRLIGIFFFKIAYDNFSNGENMWGDYVVFVLSICFIMYLFIGNIYSKNSA